MLWQQIYFVNIPLIDILIDKQCLETSVKTLDQCIWIWWYNFLIKVHIEHCVELFMWQRL